MVTSSRLLTKSAPLHRTLVVNHLYVGQHCTTVEYYHFAFDLTLRHCGWVVACFVLCDVMSPSLIAAAFVGAVNIIIHCCI